MTMHAEIAQKLPEIANLCRSHGVRQLDVFGSGARALDFDPGNSDIDLLVTYREPEKSDALRQFFGLKMALEDLLQRDVDLIEPGAVINPFVRLEIERQRETLFRE